MKVPTYHKFGLTKARMRQSEIRDKKISDILTHHLTIGIGVAFGLVIYVFYYMQVKPATLLQFVMQVFLFASLGIICVGVPAVLFKLGEMFYFKHIKEKTKEHKTITKYNEERDQYDFWRIRKDYSFWRILDGLSFEKEVMNILMHLGYEVKDDLYSDDNPNDRILSKDGSNFYLSFNTKSTEVKEIEFIDSLTKRQIEKNCNELLIFSQKGFNKKITDNLKSDNVKLYDINGIIKVVRTIKL
ncbi:MAG: hypothetical protein L0Y79_06640 [Chlorobi bacterium]|nr:hypothetical protein [Chlorobiota bacterium]MCI0715401.1 hypothetical protein [Chlorobiota bacterium]